jgi:2-iminobutanoate/2-iminopropanoate deaminase
MVKIEGHSASSVQVPSNYHQAVVVDGASRLLFVSGQIPVASDERVPVSFEEQAHLVWDNVFAQLDACGMGPDHLVKVTTFLSDRQFTELNRRVREKVLAGRKIALTVIICEIFDPAWLLEIEAIAAA